MYPTSILISPSVFFGEFSFFNLKNMISTHKKDFFFFLNPSPLICQISTTSSAGSQIYKKDSKKILLSYLVCSQIWPNLLVYDHQFCHITKLGKRKGWSPVLLHCKIGGEKNIWKNKNKNKIYIHLPPSKSYWVLNIFVVENLIKSNLKNYKETLACSWWGGLHGGDFIIFRPKSL